MDVEKVMAYHCERCGKALSKRQISCRQKYCSQDCFHNSKLYAIKNCKVCGEEISKAKIKKSMGSIKYCSAACYHDSMRLVRNEYCVQCGAGLNTRQKSKGGKYCSRKCMNERSKHSCVYVCKTCGGNFERKGREKYCSKKCKTNSPSSIARANKISIAKTGKPRSVETKRKLRLARIEQISDSGLFGGQAYPCYNKRSCLFFNKINSILGVNGLHAENGGEYRDRELGYWYDYYIPELKVIVEWDEEKHFTADGYKAKDLVRNQTIYKNKPDHLLIRVRQEYGVSIDDVIMQIVAFSGLKVVCK